MCACGNKNTERMIITYALSMIDLFCTLYATSRGVDELNPLMQDASLMVFYKVFVIGLLLLFLSRRKERIAVWGMNLCMAVYTVIDIWHIVGIFMVNAEVVMPCRL